MARLYKRGKTWWCYLRGGQRISTKCSDRKAAELAAAKLERRAADPHHAASAEATISDAIRALKEELVARGRASATLMRASQKLGHFARIWGANAMLVSVSAKGVTEYIGMRRVEGVSGTTIRDELAFLRQLLKVARRRGMWLGEPKDVLPLLFQSGHTPVQRWLHQSDAMLLLSHLEPERAAHVALILATGMRLGESMRFRRDDVYTDDVYVRGTKTKRAAVSVPITPVTRPWLDFALKHMPGEQMRPWKRLHRDVKAAAKRAGVMPTGPNDWRRSMGHWMRGEGVPVDLVAGMLRHETDRLAQTTYAKMDGAELGRAIAAVVPDMYKRNAQKPDLLEGLEFMNPRIYGQNVARPARVELATNALGKRCTPIGFLIRFQVLDDYDASLVRLLCLEFEK